MKLQIQPNAWSCMPTALAIILNEPVGDIINEIGHDGSEIIDGHVKGYHIQELNKICLKRNKTIIHFDRFPVIQHSDNILINFGDEREYINKLMKDNDGILLGLTYNEKAHSVVWNHIENCIYDPNGTIYAKGFFNIETFLMIKNLESAGK